MADENGTEESSENVTDDTPEQKISLFLAIGMVIGALAIGLVVGYLVAPKEAVGGGDLGSPAGIGGEAPTLSPDQLEGGQLPSGHPPVGDASPSSEGTGTSDAGAGTDGTTTSDGGAGAEEAPADGTEGQAETESDS